MACYYVVISSTHLRDGQLRSIKGVFRGPIGASRARSTVEKGSSLYCELCDKLYERQQQYDNHTSSYDHHHRQRLKELKQREFYRMLGSRRQRRDLEQWPRSPLQERGSARSVAGLGPMFRSTTVALDTSVEDPDVFTSCTKEPGTKQIGRSSQCLSSSSAECGFSSMDTVAKDLETSQTNVNKLPEAHDFVSHAVSLSASNNTPDDCGLSGPNIHTTSNPHRPWSDTRVHPISFSLPKRNCVLRHQSAAVFLQTPTSKERVTQTSQELTDSISGAYESLTPMQKEQKGSLDYAKKTKKEPFCRVLSRDDATVLLWPSEMVSYTRTAPSISFSVNPLLHNFRAENTTKEVPVDKRGELGRREPCVIKRAEQGQRQADVQGGGLLSRHERKQEHGGRQPAVEDVAHCISSNCDENALKSPLHSGFKGHRVLPAKTRRRKKRTRARRADRTKKKELRKRREKSITMTNVSSRERGPKRKSKDQAASNNHKRTELLSHLPVSHFNNRCKQLCAQVNSQASHHLPLRSVSEWNQGFRKLPSRGAACNAAISLVPVSDIETPRCLAITPCHTQNSTNVWEVHAETQPGENGVIPENVATGQELLGKRTFDETLNLDTLCDHNVPVAQSKADHTSQSQQFPQTQIYCEANTEQVTRALKSSNSSDTSPTIEAPPKKMKQSEKYLENWLDLMYVRSDLNIQEACDLQEIKRVTNPSIQMVTTIGRTKRNTSHFVSQSSTSKEVKQIGAKTYSCSHSTWEDRPLDRAMKKCQNTTSEHCLVTQNQHNDRCSQNVTAKNSENQVVPTQHCTTTVSSTLTVGESHKCQYNCTHHFTNCNYSEKDTGVVVLISTHPDQRRKEDQKKQVQEIRKKPTREGQWACPPQPLYLLQHFQPLSIPMPPFTPIPTHFSPHPSPLPPLLAPAFYASAPVPLLDRPPYPLATFSLQSGGPSLYSPPPPPFVPMHYIFRLPD